MLKSESNNVCMHITEQQKALSVKRNRIQYKSNAKKSQVHYTYICPALSVCLSFRPSVLPSFCPSGTLGGHARRARPKGAPEGRARPKGACSGAPEGRAPMGPLASGGGGFVYFISGILGLFHCHYICCNDTSLTQA